MGIRRSIRVIETDALSSPAVCGILRPVIVLPRGLLGSMSTMHLEWILLHELAHIRRHDLAIVWFQWLMAIVHFLNPAVWIANRMVNRLREYACDDLALVHAKASRIDSSEAFMTVVRHAASRPLAVSGVPGVFDESARASCFRRMTRLLDTKRPLQVRLTIGSLAVLLLAIAVTLPQLRSAETGVPPAPSGPDSKTPTLDPDQPVTFREAVADSFQAYYVSQSGHRGEAEEFRKQVARHWPYDDAALDEERKAYEDTQKEVSSLYSRAKGGEEPPIDRDEAVRQILDLAAAYPNTPLSDKARLDAARLCLGAKPEREDDYFDLLREVASSQAPLNVAQISAKRNLVNEPHAGYRELGNLQRFYGWLRDLRDSRVLADRLLTPLPVESLESYLKRVSETLAAMERYYPELPASMTTAAHTVPESGETRSFRQGVAQSFEEYVPAASAYFALQHIHRRRREGADIKRRGRVAGEEFRRQVAKHWPYDDASLKEQRKAYQDASKVVLSLVSRAKGGERPSLDRDEAVRQILRLAERFPHTPLSDEARFYAAHLFSDVEPRQEDGFFKLMQDVASSKAPLNSRQIMAKENVINHPRTRNRFEEHEFFYAWLRELEDPQVFADCLLNPQPIESQDSYLKRVSGVLAQIEAQYPLGATDVTAAETSASHLTGTVVDSEGRPAGGCTVQLFDYSARQRQWLAPATTDAQGKFSLPVADENVLSSSRTCAVRARLPDTVELVLDGALTYRAQFKDSTGKPVQDLRIAPHVFQKPGKPYYLNTTYSRTIDVNTNAQGIAAFGWIPTKLERGQIDLSIDYGEYPSWERPAFTVKESDEGSPRPDVVVELAVPAIVTGTVTARDQAPLAGVAVGNGGSAVLTDADGNYRVQVVPASNLHGDERILTLSAPGWAGSAISVPAPKPGQRARNVDATLDPGSIASIQIVVDEGKTPFSEARQRIYKLGRLPASGPVVSVRSSGEQASSFYDTLTPDDEGRCQTRLAPGTYALTAQVPFFKVDRKPIELVVPERGEPEPVTIQASSIETKVCRFRAVDSDAPDVGLAGATVWFSRDFAAGLYNWRQAQTDAEGRIRILRADATVAYYACSEDQNWAALGMVDAEQTGESTITLKPAARVKGRFVDRRGAPVTDGNVRMEIDSLADQNLANLSPGSGIPGQVTNVGEDGGFEMIGVATGLAYRVSLTRFVENVLPSGGRAVSYQTIGTERLKVNDSGFVDLGDIECEYQPVEPSPPEHAAALPTLDAGAAEKAIAAARAASAPSFHGTVTDPQGQPAAGCEVRLIAITSPGTTAPVYRSEPVKTDEQGRYSISTGPVQDGVAAIGLRAWSADGRQMGHVDPRILRKLYSRPLITLYSVTLSRLTKEPVDIQLAPVEETIVHVQNGEGRPIPEASVEARVSNSLPPLAAPVTDAEGNTVLRYPKGAGIYCIVALKSKQGLDWFENRASNGGPFEAAGPLPNRVEITLTEARTRRIQLLDTAGRALQGLTVRPNYFKKANHQSPATFEWSSIASVVTDEQGVATFDWLPADASTLEGGPTLSFEPVSFIYCLGYGFRIPFNASENDRLCQIVLAPSAVVSGRVTRPDGSPAAGVRICPETHDSQNLVCFTDADGRYSFRVMPNKFEGPRPNSIDSAPRPLTVVVSDFSRDNPWVAKPLGPMFLTSGQTVNDANFQLARGTQVTVRLVIDDGVTIYGDLLKRIEDHEAPIRGRPRLTLAFLKSEDAPKPAAEIVNSNDRDWSYRKLIRFDETGQASFSLPPGSFRLTPSIPCVTYELPEGIDPQETLISARPETEFTLSEEDKERTFEIRVFTDVTREYRLRTVRADNPDTTVAGAAIQVEPDTQAVFEPIRLTTNAEGEATIRRSNRPLTFLAYSADRKLGASEEWLKLDPESDVVTICMRPTRTATGRFLDRSGQPLKKCRVICRTTRTVPLYSERGKSRLMLSHDPTIETSTDDEGRFTVDHLIPGVGYEFRVWEYLDQYERAMPVGDKEIEVPIDPSTTPIDCGDIRGRY